MDKKEQTIIEHLSEFRRRFLSILVCFAVVFIISLFFSADIYKWLTSSFHKKLIVLGPDDILWIYINLANLVAFSLTLPFMIYQIWEFIRPALQENEAISIFLYVPASFFCFLAGLAFGFYFVSPTILQVLLSLGKGLFDTQLTAQNYLAFLFHTTIPIAILFELPVIVVFLTSIGLLKPKFLVQYRRYAYFTLLVLAVVLTPADFVSDLSMAVPLILLYEVSVMLSKMVYKRKLKRRL
ncbi:MAG: twin-arginine translocase subunit TatC [Streptococcus sp.]|nr:twin-arginine translocase subunit TatC [Streptococcus sp.]